MRVWGLVLLGALSLACSTGTPLTIHASDYNQSCKVAADCTLIDEGSGCCTGCGNAAINVADQAKYQTQAQQRQSGCGQVACPAIACVFSMAYCNAGKCDVCHSGTCGDGGTTD